MCCSVGKDSGLQMRESMRGQLKEACSATSKAFSSYRREVVSDLEALGQSSEIFGVEETAEETQMNQTIAIMKPVLRYLQLLCENHNSDLQVTESHQKAFWNIQTLAPEWLFLSFVCSSELSAQSGQQDELQSGVWDASVPGLHLRQHHRRSGFVGTLYQWGERGSGAPNPGNPYRVLPGTLPREPGRETKDRLAEITCYSICRF